MTILLIGSETNWALEPVYIKYIHKSHAIELLNARGRFYNYYYKNFGNKLLFKLGLSKILKEINHDIIEKIEKQHFDLVWVWKGMELFPNTLLKIKRKGIKVVNYNPDNPFIFSGTGSGNKHVRQSIPLYDYHFTYDREVKDRLQKEYSAPCDILPFGFDISDELYNECIKEAEIMRLCFLGNPDKQRAALLTQILEQGIPIDVYGRNWEKFITHPHLTINQAVYGVEFWKILRKYRIQLNIMRPHNENSHNMRSFEIPGVGGIMLAPQTPDHEQYFVDRSEVWLYRDVEECVVQIKYLLTLSADEANKIRAAARQRSLESGYNYEARSACVIKTFERLLSEG
ncbi:MAG TPA: glycosyltransferase [Flavipsychrobacter sp.]|nr:glycosyltransferase [Flavipsychrobacter sp.]